MRNRTTEAMCETLKALQRVRSDDYATIDATIYHRIVAYSRPSRTDELRGVALAARLTWGGFTALGRLRAESLSD